MEEKMATRVIKREREEDEGEKEEIEEERGIIIKRKREEGGGREMIEDGGLRMEVPGCKRPLSTQDPDYIQRPDPKRLRQMQDRAQEELSERVVKVVERVLSEAMVEKQTEMEEIDQRILRLQQCLHTLRCCVSLNYYAATKVNREGEVEQRAVMHPTVRRHLSRKSQDSTLYENPCPANNNNNNTGLGEGAMDSSSQTSATRKTSIRLSSRLNEGDRRKRTIENVTIGSESEGGTSKKSNKKLIESDKVAYMNEGEINNKSSESDTVGSKSKGDGNKKPFTSNLNERNVTPSKTSCSSSNSSSSSDPPPTCPRPPSPKYLPPKPPDTLLTIPQGRRQHLQTKCRLIVGNTYQYLTDGEAGDRMRYKWQVYVRSPPEDQPAASFIAAVTFLLDDSYAPHHVITLRQAPFVLSRRGWGEFKVQISLQLKDARNKPVKFLHPLVLSRQDDPLALTGLWRLGQENWYNMWVYMPSPETTKTYNDTTTNNNKTGVVTTGEERDDGSPASLVRELETGVVSSLVDGHVTVQHQPSFPRDTTACKHSLFPPSVRDQTHSQPTMPHTRAHSSPYKHTHAPSITHTNSPFTTPHTHTNSPSTSCSAFEESVLGSEENQSSATRTRTGWTEISPVNKKLMLLSGVGVRDAEHTNDRADSNSQVEMTEESGSEGKRNKAEKWKCGSDGDRSKGAGVNESKMGEGSSVGVSVNGYDSNKLCRIHVKQSDGRLLPFLIPARMYSLALKVAQNSAARKQQEGQGVTEEGQAAVPGPHSLQERSAIEQKSAETSAVQCDGVGIIKQDPVVHIVSSGSSSSSSSSSSSTVIETGHRHGQLKILNTGREPQQVIVRGGGTQENVALVQQLLHKQRQILKEAQKKEKEQQQQQGTLANISPPTTPPKTNIQLMPVKFIQQFATKGGKPVKIVSQKPIGAANIKFVTNNGQFILTGKLLNNKCKSGAATTPVVVSSVVPLTNSTTITTTTTNTNNVMTPTTLMQGRKVIDGAGLLQLLATKSKKMALKQVSPLKAMDNALQMQPLVLQGSAVSLLRGDNTQQQQLQQQHTTTSIRSLTPTPTTFLVSPAGGDSSSVVVPSVLNTSNKTLMPTPSTTYLVTPARGDSITAVSSSILTTNKNKTLMPTPTAFLVPPAGGDSTTEVLPSAPTTTNGPSSGSTKPATKVNKQKDDISREAAEEKEREARLLWEDKLRRVREACSESSSMAMCVSMWLKVLPLVVPPNQPPPPPSLIPFCMASSHQQFLQWPLPKQRASEFQRAREVVRRMRGCDSEGWGVLQVVAWARRHAYTPTHTRPFLRSDQLALPLPCPPHNPEGTLSVLEEGAHGTCTLLHSSPIKHTEVDVVTVDEEDEHTKNILHHASPVKPPGRPEVLVACGVAEGCGPDECEWVGRAVSQLRAQVSTEVVQPGYRAHAAASTLWKAMLCLMEDLLRASHCQAWGEDGEPSEQQTSNGNNNSCSTSSWPSTPLPSTSTTSTSSTTFSSSLSIPSGSSTNNINNPSSSTIFPSTSSSSVRNVPPRLISLRHVLAALATRQEFDLFTDCDLGTLAEDLG